MLALERSRERIKPEHADVNRINGSVSMLFCLFINVTGNCLHALVILFIGYQIGLASFSWRLDGSDKLCWFIILRAGFSSVLY